MMLCMQDHLLLVEFGDRFEKLHFGLYEPGENQQVVVAGSDDHSSNRKLLSGTMLQLGYFGCQSQAKTILPNVFLLKVTYVNDDLILRVFLIREKNPREKNPRKN